MISEARAVRAAGGSKTLAEGSVPYEPRRPPIYGDQRTWDVLERRLPPTLPATRVVDLPGAKVVGPAGWVVLEDRALVSLSWYESVDRRPTLSAVSWTTEIRLSGTLLNLSTVNGATNYGHFLLDGLGRLAVARQVGIRPKDVDWVLVPGFSSAATDALVRRLRIPDHKIVRPQADTAICADRVLTPSLPGTSRTYRPVVADFFRRVVRPPRRPAGVKLFVTRRGGRRAILNIEDVEHEAAQRGYHVVDATSVDLPRAMGEASAVVGPHGAALADLAFCRPGTPVIELIPSDHMYGYWYSLALAARLDYRAVITPSTQMRPMEEWGSSPYDVVVPIDLLAQALAGVHQRVAG